MVVREIKHALDDQFLLDKFNEFIIYVKNNFHILGSPSTGWSKHNIEHLDNINSPIFEEHKYKPISIAIVNWQRYAYIPYILHQVYSQDYPHELIEIVVVDQGGSKQEELQNICKAVAKKYSSMKIKYFQHNSDPILNTRIRRNTGIRFSSNDIVLLIESDTIILGNQHLKKVSWYFTLQPKTMLIPITFKLSSLSHLPVTAFKIDQSFGNVSIKTEDWLPYIFDDPKYKFDVVHRLDHDFCNSLPRKVVSEFNGYPEKYTGYGGIEGDLFYSCIPLGILPRYVPDLMAFQLYDFPEAVDEDLKPATYADNKTLNDTVKDSWGTTLGMEEVDLYK